MPTWVCLSCGARATGGSSTACPACGGRLLNHDKLRASTSRLRPDDEAPPTPAAAALRPGETFGRYRIDAVVGEGGMGIVYRAQDPELRRTVALKILKITSFSDPGQADRFRREAELAARLHHPAIVAVHDFGVESGPALLGSPPGTRDLAEGVARSWLESGRLREAVTAAAVRLGGLEAANRLVVPWGWRADFAVMDPATQETVVSCDGRAVGSIRILHALLAQAELEGRASVRVEAEGPGGVRAWDAAVSDLGSRALDEILVLRRLEQDF